MCREDARSAVDAGVAAVWVSNHGGRQVDCAPPTVKRVQLYSAHGNKAYASSSITDETRQ